MRRRVVRQWTTWLVLLVLGVMPMQGDTQVAALVFDPTNFGANTLTSIQSVITAANSVISVANQALELLPLEEIVLAAEFVETVAIISAILEEAGALAYDVESIQAQVDTLFDLHTAPNTPELLEARIAEITTVVHQARTYALRVQTLLHTLLGAVGHVLRLVQLIGILTGNQSSNEVLIQLSATLNTTLATQTAMTATWQRSDVLKHLARDLVVASYNRIQADRWVEWPTLGAL